jgi:ABC-type Na+ efflux pump permease subunit
MKSQRRHELQHNVLDAEIAKGVQYARSHRTILSWGVVIAAVALLVVWLAVGHVRKKGLEAQRQYERLTMDAEITEAEQMDGLKTLSQGRDKRYAALALVRLGDVYAMQLLGAMGMPAAQQGELAEMAAGFYRQVIDRYPDQKQAVAEARLGLGKLSESRGDLAAAREQYQAVLMMTELAGRPVLVRAQMEMQGLEAIRGPIRMATTTSAPASAPATDKVASRPAPQPAAK